MNMKTKIQQQPNQSKRSGFLARLSHFLKNALVRTGGSKLVFGSDSPGRSHDLASRTPPPP